MVLTLPKEKTDDQTDEEYSSYLQDFDPAQDFLDKYTESTDPTKTDFGVEAYKGDEGRGLAGVNRSELGIPEDNEFVEQYSEHMGLPNLPDLEFPIAFCYFRMAAILQGVKKRALDGNASNPDRAIKMGQYVIEFAKKAEGKVLIILQLFI